MKMQIVFHCIPRARVEKTYYTLDIDVFLKEHANEMIRDGKFEFCFGQC